MLPFLDHPQHGTQILGGMWGFKTKKNRALANRIFNLITDPALARKYNGDLQSPKGADQVRAFIFVLIKLI